MIKWPLDADMQRRAGLGLNKGEAHHALKSALRIGRQERSATGRPEPGTSGSRFDWMEGSARKAVESAPVRPSNISRQDREASCPITRASM